MLKFIVMILSVFLIQCTHISNPTTDPLPKTAKEERSSNFGKLFGDLTFLPFGSKDKPVIGVNTYLWRASLDALSFMPLTSADPFGGIIITDWYTSAKNPHERFKVTIFIIGRQLQSNALQIKIFRQLYEKNQWRDAAVKTASIDALEETIFKRARHIKAQQRAKV